MRRGQGAGALGMDLGQQPQADLKTARRGEWTVPGTRPAARCASQVHLSPHRRRRGEDRTPQEGRRRNPPQAPAGDGFRPRLDPCRKPTQHRRDREGSRQTAAGLAEQGRCRCSRRGRARFSRMEEIHEAALCRSATSRPAGFIAILSTDPGQPCPAFLRIAPADQRSHCAGVPA